jgi:hypothetical protein
MNKPKNVTYKIAQGQYLKDIIGEIHTNIILFKQLTGIGATTLELETPRHSIIIEPNVPVIQGKCKKYNTTRKVKVFGVFEGKTVDQIIDYLESNIEHKKIITTPESFLKVKEAMDELVIDMYKDYFLLMDECERSIQDVGYRGKIILPINDFFKFKNKAFVSATPILPSDPRFAQQNFKHVFIEPDFNHEERLLVIETNNVLLTLKKFIGECPREQYFIFFNSTDTIAHLITELGVKDQSAIFCAKESMQKLKVNNFTHVSTTLADFKKFNWFTSRFFSAVDIEGIVDPTIIMISDLISAQHSTIDPKSEAIQIVGRFRKPQDGTITKEIIHITNFAPELNSKSEQEAINYINECEAIYSFIKKFLDAATATEAVETLREVLVLIEFAKYLNPDGTRNYFMQDNTVYEEKVKGYYQSLKNLLAGYKATKHFFLAHSTESYNITDAERALKQPSVALKTVYSVIMPMIGKLQDPEQTSAFSRDFQMMHLRQEFGKVVEDFDRLGLEVAKQLNFDPRRIKAEVKKRDKESQNSNFGFLQYIDSNFKVGETRTSSYLINTLRNGIKENNLNHLTASVKLLKAYVELSGRMWVGTSEDGRDLHGYRILKIYNKLKD